MATHSSVLTLRIPGMGKPGGLPFMGSHRIGHDWSGLAAATDLWASPVAQSLLPVQETQEIQVRFLSQEDPLE